MLSIQPVMIWLCVIEVSQWICREIRGAYIHHCVILVRVLQSAPSHVLNWSQSISITVVTSIWRRNSFAQLSFIEYLNDWTRHILSCDERTLSALTSKHFEHENVKQWWLQQICQSIDHTCSKGIDRTSMGIECSDDESIFNLNFNVNSLIIHHMTFSLDSISFLRDHQNQFMELQVR